MDHIQNVDQVELPIYGVLDRNTSHRESCDNSLEQLIHKKQQTNK